MIDYIDMKTGVYAIVNLVNGNAYVGSAAVSFEKRFRNHRYELARGKHHSQPLQRAWDKYGADAFEFSPIEFAAPDEAVPTEQRYIDGWRPAYNVAPVAGSALGVKHTHTAKVNMRQACARVSARPEVKAHRSAGQKAAWALPDSRARRIEVQNRPDVRERRSASVLTSWCDPAVAAKRVAGIKEFNACPEVKARKAESFREKWLDPVFKAQQSDIKKSRWADPEYRARMSVMSKETHARPGDKEQRSAAISAACRARSQITQEIAAEILVALAEGQFGQSIASRYRVSASVISAIKHGTHWSVQ